MSPTTEDLRARMAAELDDLGTLPDLVPAAARAGSQTLRRRRLAVGSALGVVAVGGGALAAPGGSGGHLATSPTTSPSPAWDPTADGHVTTDEWHETVRRTLESLLPERYGTVSTGPAERNRAQAFTTSGGDPRLQISLGVSGRDAADDSTHSCASQERARDILSCDEAQLDDGWSAVATTELAPPTGDGGAAAYGTSLLFLNEGVFVELSASELGWDGLEPNALANLAVEELVDLASTPEFLEMVRVGVEWDLDQPASPDDITVDTDPVWPVGS